MSRSGEHGDRSRRRGWSRVRRLGATLIVVGVVVVAYVGTVVLWRDPATDVYTRYRQHQLSAELETEMRAWPQVRSDLGAQASPAELSSRVANGARRFERGLREGHAMGRLEIPRLDLSVVFVEGTDWADDLSKGPGHYVNTSVPGLGRTTAIAGHRTTFGAPFRHIDDLRSGDSLVVELPYGTFRYRVFSHEIVSADDWSIIRKRSFDTLVLSACHPLYSASHRWVVFGRLQEVQLPEGAGKYVLAAGNGQPS